MGHIERELPEMRALLKKHGFDPKHAERLSAEGMGPYELESRLRHPAGSVGSLEYTHNLKRAQSLYKRFVAKHGVRGIPDRGFCIGRAGGAGYEACFLKKNFARRAAQMLAHEIHERVDLVQVQNRGEDRFNIGEFFPKWGK